MFRLYVHATLSKASFALWSPICHLLSRLFAIMDISDTPSKPLFLAKKSRASSAEYFQDMTDKRNETWSGLPGGGTHHYLNG